MAKAIVLEEGNKKFTINVGDTFKIKYYRDSRIHDTNITYIEKFEVKKAATVKGEKKIKGHTFFSTFISLDGKGLGLTKENFVSFDMFMDTFKDGNGIKIVNEHEIHRYSDGKVVYKAKRVVK